jgi:quercetin dioxygenase-like cupin family protein
MDHSGVNAVLIDENLQPLGAPYAQGEIYVAWASDATNSAVDAVEALRGSALDLQLRPGESRYLRIEIRPGASAVMHRTPYITDYLVALSGKLTMVAEDGSTAVMEAGDMLVQLGGFHYLRNDGDELFVMAVVVVGVETDETFPGGVEIAPKWTSDIPAEGRCG